MITETGRYFRSVEKRMTLRHYLWCWCFYTYCIPLFIWRQTKDYWNARPKRMQRVMEECAEEESQFQEVIIKGRDPFYINGKEVPVQ